MIGDTDSVGVQPPGSPPPAWLGPRDPSDDRRRELPANFTLDGDDDNTELPADPAPEGDEGEDEHSDDDAD